MMGYSSPQNDTDPLRKESDQLNSKGVSFSESTVASSEYMYSGRIKDGGTANPSPDISDVDAGPTTATELSGPSSFLMAGHDNKTSSTGHLGAAVYEREAVFEDINAERINSSVETTDKDAEKFSGVLEKPFKLDMDNERAGNCTECCGTVKNGKNACDGAGDETGAVGADSVANLTAQDSTIRSGIAAPVTRDEHDSGSPHNTVGSVALPSRDRKPTFMPSAENLYSRDEWQFSRAMPKWRWNELLVACAGEMLFFLLIIFCFAFAKSPSCFEEDKCQNLMTDEESYV
jgi:hypothetical protein